MTDTGMTLHMYPEFVKSLLKDMGSDADNLMHTAVGVSGEAGELLDAIKKHWAYGKPLDIENIIEELGDLEFYMEALRQLLNITRDQTILGNIEKLPKRYPTGKYSDQQAIARADKAQDISVGLTD